LLTERQKLILRAVVDDYIRYAEPVGSRAISKRKEINHSAATVRNDMSDLEEMGYLEQPYTSAGRIPSQKGYRFYVDNLMSPHAFQTVDINDLKYLFLNRLLRQEQLLQQAASILSNLTNYTAVALGPRVFEAKVKHFQIVPLSEGRAVCIMVTDTGHVEHRQIMLPSAFQVDEIEKLVRLLNDKLTGTLLHQMKQHIYSEIASELTRNAEQVEAIISLLDQLTQSDDDERVYLGGALNILMQPEFRDLDKMKDLIYLLEHHDLIAQVISDAGQGVQVRIGEENDLEAVNQCSIVTATYRVSDNGIGTIGIIGPTRMDYSKVIGLLKYVSRDLSKVFGHRDVE
jgi:heat-inducible transcriptional repressor